LVHVIDFIVGLAIGTGGALIGSLAGPWLWVVLRKLQSRSVHPETSPSGDGKEHGHARSVRARVGAASVLDPSGASIYALMRSILKVSHPDKSATQAFRASARTIADAYDEAVRDRQRM
jgi:hypothetical protein